MAVRVQQALLLTTKKQAAQVVRVVVQCLEATLLNNLGTDGFTLKLDSFGKFSVRHKAGILRRIPFTGETILTRDRRKVRFVSLGELRQRDRFFRSNPSSMFRVPNLIGMRAWSP